MKFTLSFVLLFGWLISHAQQPIQIDSTHMPTIGWQQRIARDTFPLPTISFGNAGANQVWDFSALTPISYDTTEYRALTTAQRSTYPNANLAVTNDGTNFLMTRTTSQKSSLEGLQGVLSGNTTNAVFSPVDDLYKFPSQYGSTFTGNWGFVTTVPGSAVGQPLVYQIRLTFTASFFDTIDGWGKTITPIGAYNSLRQKRKEYSNTVIDIKLTAISQFTNFSNTRDTTIRYNYLSQETKGNILNFEFDSLDNVRQVSYSLIPPVTPVANFTFTNPSGGYTVFTDRTTGNPDTYSWDFGDGSSSTAQNPNHNYTANGEYVACLTVTYTGGSSTHCDTVRITGLGGGNNPPVAFNDATEVLQPNDTTVNVGLNDTDPDGDNICVTEVIGSSAFSIAPTGNCTSISYNPAATFTGYDTCYYVLCDNGTPVLCDTAMLVIHSVNNPALLPVPSFTSNLNVFDCSQGQNYSAYDFMQLINASIDADSAAWRVFEVGGSNSIVSSVDTLNNVSGLFWGNEPQNIGVCITAYNQYGSVTYCDTTCNLVWESIEKVEGYSISLIPNPTNDFVSVRLQQLSGYAGSNPNAIVFYNLLGEKVMSREILAGQQLLNVSVASLSAGVYLTAITDEHGNVIGRSRLVKQ